MNDPVVQQLQLALDTHGRALLERRADLEQLLAGARASYPGKVQALLLVLDNQAVSFLAGWAADTRADKPDYVRVREQIADKFVQANLLDPGAAAWAVDAWAQALRMAPAAQAAATPAAAQAPRNVYAPPAAPVRDQAAPVQDEAGFLPAGRGVRAGRGIAWIGDGWRLFKPSALIWIVNVVLFLMITVAVQVVPFVGGVAGALLAPVLAGGLMIGARAVQRGEALEVAHLFEGFREHTGSLVLVGVVYLVSVAILVLIAVGLMLMIGVRVFDPAPGLPPDFALRVLLVVLVVLALAIPLTMAYWFAPALVALNGLKPVAAMKASFMGCLKNILPFLLFGLVAMLAGLVALIPLGLGWLVLGPVLVAAMYASYRDIFYAQ